MKPLHCPIFHVWKNKRSQRLCSKLWKHTTHVVVTGPEGPWGPEGVFGASCDFTTARFSGLHVSTEKVKMDLFSSFFWQTTHIYFSEKIFIKQKIHLYLNVCQQGSYVHNRLEALANSLYGVRCVMMARFLDFLEKNLSGTDFIFTHWSMYLIYSYFCLYKIQAVMRDCFSWMAYLHLARTNSNHRWLLLLCCCRVNTALETHLSRPHSFKSSYFLVTVFWKAALSLLWGFKPSIYITLIEETKSIIKDFAGLIAGNVMQQHGHTTN